MSTAPITSTQYYVDKIIAAESDLASIPSIVLDDELLTILYRLVDFSIVPDGDVYFTLQNHVLSYENIILHESLTKPTLEEMNAEFLVWKNERLSAAQLFLDKLNTLNSFASRIEALADRNYSIFELYAVSNPEMYLVENVFKNDDLVAADLIVQAIETKDAELESIENAKKIEEQAKKDLIKDKNASVKDRLDALIEYLGLDI